MWSTRAAACLDELEAARPDHGAGNEVAVDDRLLDGLQQHAARDRRRDEHGQVAHQLRVQRQAERAVPAKQHLRPSGKAKATSRPMSEDRVSTAC